MIFLKVHIIINTGSSTQNPDPIPSSDVTVSFALLGDDAHGESGTTHTLRAGNLTTWIAQTPVKIASGSNVMTVLAKVLNQNNYSWMNDDEANSNTGNYIQSITTPAGITLAEFTNGPNSGWMHTLNGTHPLLGVNEQTVAGGDVIVFHYTDDYTKEEGSDKWSDSPSTPTTTATTDKTIIRQAVTTVNGKANVSINAGDVEDAISAAKDNGGAVTIAPTVTGTATKMTVALPTASLSSMVADAGASLTVQTPVGNVTLPPAALSSISSQASGSTMTVSLDTVNTTALTAEQQKSAGTDTVYDISVLSGSAAISSFGGGGISIFLPYALKDGETGENVTIWYLNDEGKLQQMSCVYDKTTGLASFTTTHLSYYIVRYDAWTNPFTDVNPSDWFYGAVKYVSQNSLMSGTNDTVFEPSTDMTRAMPVTMLYRLESKPAVTGINSFTDVADGKWYTNAVIWANANGIVSGYGGRLFRAGNSITREQLAVILYNYAKYKSYDVTATSDLKAYTDAASTSTWADAAMKWAVGEGLITGTAGTTFAPSGKVSKGIVETGIKLLCRVGIHLPVVFFLCGNIFARLVFSSLRTVTIKR